MYQVRNRRLWVCFLPAALLIVAHFAWGDTLTGRVVGVADGDTVTILDADHQQHRVRLQGIDAPEKAQPFGQRSKENLSRLVAGKDVRVDWAKRDKYKRIVGKYGCNLPVARLAR